MIRGRFVKSTERVSGKLLLAFGILDCLESIVVRGRGGGYEQAGPSRTKT